MCSVCVCACVLQKTLVDRLNNVHQSMLCAICGSYRFIILHLFLFFPQISSFFTFFEHIYHKGTKEQRVPFIACNTLGTRTAQFFSFYQHVIFAATRAKQTIAPAPSTCFNIQSFYHQFSSYLHRRKNCI